MKTIVVLDNIRSAHNVGSVFRTSDGAGVEKLYLVGTTPAPVDRFGREQMEIKKTSLGAGAHVAWESIGAYDTLATKEVLQLLQQLQREGYSIVAVEQTSVAVDLFTWQPPERVVYVFGNEIDGVQAEILQMADTTVLVPMAGRKESLNVSVCAGVVLYHSRGERIES